MSFACLFTRTKTSEADLSGENGEIGSPNHSAARLAAWEAFLHFRVLVFSASFPSCVPSSKDFAGRNDSHRPAQPGFVPVSNIFVLRKFLACCHTTLRMPSFLSSA